MSLEQKIAELLESNTAVVAALSANTAVLERVVAGQAAAMEKLEGAKPATTRTPRKPKDEPAAAAPAETETPGKSEEPAATASPEVAATTAYKAPAIADAAALQAWVGEWTGAVEGEDRTKRVAFLKSTAAHLGVAPKFGEIFPHVKKFVFFIERYKAVGEFPLSNDFDFDGDPSQGATTAPAEDDSDFD